MKKRFTVPLLAVLFLAGMGLLLYPTLSNRWNALHQSRAIAGYVQSIAETGAARQEEMLEHAAAYNRKLAVNNGARFFPAEEESAEYRSLLNLNETGIMGYIEIGRIGCSLPIYHGTEDSVLQIAVGHIEGTSLPVGGAGTHCVLSGHRGLPSAKIFSDLNLLEPGDTFVIHTLSEVLTYEVESTRIVLPSDTGDLQIEAGADLCTLMTCTPYGVNSHRLLVRGRRTENRTADAAYVRSDALALPVSVTVPLYAAPLLLLLWIGARAASRNAGKRKTVMKKLQ